MDSFQMENSLKYKNIYLKKIPIFNSNYLSAGFKDDGWQKSK